jgi:Vacuolar sorting 38 and autophagy-related subunit 14
MQCQICFRTGGHKLPFLCPTDARNALYEPRLENAKVLLEKDTLAKQISPIMSDKTGTEPTKIQDKELGESRTLWEIEQNDAEGELAIDRTRQIMATADNLRRKIEAAKIDISQRKAVINRRRSELASAVNGLEARRTRQVEDAERSINRTKHKWNLMHLTMAQSRAFLCGEAAKLYGLRRLSEPGLLPDEYGIGGVHIVDLRNMNGASAAQITTSLSHIAHLLVLTSHYLALCLPAEITLPHRDYPLPTVLSLSSSHMYSNIPFPGSTPQQSSNNSPTASRHAETSGLPRPRPLFITKPLPLLAKEDPSAYSFFVEGTVLLAYNVAWVCKSQGITVGAPGNTSFEDVCAIGRNLFNLLIGNTPRPNPGSRTPSVASTPITTATSTPTKAKPNSIAAPETPESGIEGGKKTTNQPALFMGHFSHGTAHTFLGSPEGNELVRSFKLPSPVKLADKLKTLLSSEISSAEWEVLDPDAWAEGEGKELEDEGVIIGASRDERPRRRLGGGLGFGNAVQSFMSMRTVLDAVEIVGGDKKPGTSGWTKLKPR